MRPTGDANRWRGTAGSSALPAGPAMMTLRSVVAPLASTIRSAGIAYIVAQVVIWHSFYTADWRRLAAPVIAVAWAAAVIVCLRRRWPSPFLACIDSAFYLALALSAQECVPPSVRDDAFSWLVICMSGQLIVPAWYATATLGLLLTILAPAAYCLGAVIQPVSNVRTLVGATMILIVVGLVHTFSRRELYGRAEAAEATLDAAAHAAGEQYAELARNIERREHERLLHDTVLNTLTALARAGTEDPAVVVSRCRQDVALIEDALGDQGDPAAGQVARRASGDLAGEVQAVAADLRARGLTVHVDSDGVSAAVPARVTAAIANATREALSNVAEHAGTGEAWVQVRLTAPAFDADVPCRLEVTVRDRGAGFDLDRVDPARLGLSRSIAERTAECGGQAAVWSAPGQGTVVRMRWPAAARSGRPGGEPDPPGGEPDGPGGLRADRGLTQESPSC
ncbi:MAG TPA: ATP-binding protein [Streptosporangiaceae bacterium]